jgi:hypothetical protein
MRKLYVSALYICSLAGCSQLLGVGDYEIDPALDGTGGSRVEPVGGEAGAPIGQAGSSGGSGGSSGSGGSGGSLGGEGGAPPIPVGGEAGQGGAPPTLIPCDSEECCRDAGGNAVGVELLSDGGFELGASDGPWTEESTLGYEAISEYDPDIGFRPHAGDYFVYLSGLAGERTSIYSEDVQIPADAGWLVVSGFRKFQIDVQDETNADFALVAFYDPTDAEGTALEIPFFWSNPAEYADGWGATNSAWKSFEASWSAEPHAGGKRYLGLRGESDEHPMVPPEDTETSTASSYLFDDVSLKVFRCYE